MSLCLQYFVPPLNPLLEVVRMHCMMRAGFSISHAEVTEHQPNDIQQAMKPHRDEARERDKGL